VGEPPLSQSGGTYWLRGQEREGCAIGQGA
jgi:hypothetical protein